MWSFSIQHLVPWPGIKPRCLALGAQSLSHWTTRKSLQRPLPPPFKIIYLFWGFPGRSEVKASASNAGDPGSIPGSGRPPGEGNGNPLQYSCLENPMDRGDWQATVHAVTESKKTEWLIHRFTDKEAFYSYITRRGFRNMRLCSKEFLEIRYE